MDKDTLINTVNKRSAYNIHNGLTVTDVDAEHCTVEAELRPEAMNPWEMAHGGFVYSLCDVAAGSLVTHMINKGVTLSSNMHFLRPSKGTKLRAEGKVIKKGKSVVVVDTFVYDDREVLTAKGCFEIFVLDRP